MKINGIATEYQRGGTPSTLLELLQRGGYNPLHVVVERNGEIITREQFSDTTLQEDDELNILHFMGGGCAWS